jgi:hypothetical protein
MRRADLSEIAGQAIADELKPLRFFARPSPTEEIDHLAALAPEVRIEKTDVHTPVPPQRTAVLAEVCKAGLHVNHTPDLYTRVGLEGVRPKQTTSQLALV